MKKKPKKRNTTDIVEFQEDDRVIDGDTILSTGTMYITTYNTVENKMTENQVENKDTAEEMDFDELTITGDSYYHIFEEEHELISLNNIVWVKVNKAIWQGKVTQTNFSDIKEDSEYLKTKWIYTRK